MREEYDFYGYNSPTSGKYYIGEVEYFYGEDYRSVKRYKEYKNAGFNILLLQHENSYSGEDFESSACNKCMVNAYKAGIDKIIVSDTRLKDLCIEKKLIGDGGRFKAEKEFYDYLDFCTEPYRNKRGFFGIQLYDEPFYDALASYGKVYRGLKKLMPSVYLQCNLLPITGQDYLAKKSENEFHAYECYLNDYLDETDADCLLFDEYPFLREYYLGVYSLRTYQIAAKVCKERGKELHSVLQSFSSFNKDHLIHRRITEKDMYWQMNLALGFGVREISFFTYFTKSCVRLCDGKPLENANASVHLCGYPSSDGLDGAAFINRDGSKTKLYHYTRRIISEVKRFVPQLLKYDYYDSYLRFAEGKRNIDFLQTKHALINECCPFEISVSKDVALITELRGKNGAVMYMIENFSNVKDEFVESEPMRVVFGFKEKNDKAVFYYRGRRISVRRKGNVFIKNLHCGDAVFVAFE